MASISAAVIQCILACTAAASASLLLLVQTACDLGAPATAASAVLPPATATPTPSVAEALPVAPPLLPRRRIRLPVPSLPAAPVPSNT
jgi:hypothetical protein